MPGTDRLLGKVLGSTYYLEPFKHISPYNQTLISYRTTGAAFGPSFISGGGVNSGGCRSPGPPIPAKVRRPLGLSMSRSAGIVRRPCNPKVTVATAGPPIGFPGCSGCRAQKPATGPGQPCTRTPRPACNCDSSRRWQRLWAATASGPFRR